MKANASILSHRERLLKFSKQIFAFAILLAIWSGSVSASWLDNDYWCRVYGCVVTSDGTAYDIYDVYDFSRGRAVSVGSPLKFWSSNPYQGSGMVDAVSTGTLQPIVEPSSTQGSLLGIDQNGDGIADQEMLDSNNSGFIDLGDSFLSIPLGVATDIVNSNDTTKHSFYVASRTDFYIYGTATLLLETQNMSDNVSPSETSFNVSMQQKGTDAGFSFGSATSNPDFVATNGINDLGDIWGVPTRIAEFKRSAGTRRTNSTDVKNQAVRMDIGFRAPAPDFSFGTGELNYKVVYDFYNR